MLLTSSILTHYSTNDHSHPFEEYFILEYFILTLQVRVARWLSIFLRRFGKVIAAFNAIWIVATGLFQFSRFYDRCYCDSAVMGLGKRAYIVFVPGGVGGMRIPCVASFVLAAGAAMIFTGFVTRFIDPPLPP